jgi:hypothetical protein
MKHCENCGNEFLPYSGRQRFCTRECSDGWFANERKEAVAEHRRKRFDPSANAEAGNEA